MPSLYIQTTTKCNMRCGHCCYSCEPGKGENMSLKVFKAALELSQGYCVIGGGEPTCHPQFEKFLLLAVAAQAEMGSVHVITNGKNQERARMLLELAHKGVIGSELSQDRWHEPLDPDFVELWEGKVRPRYAPDSHFNARSLAGIRNVGVIEEMNGTETQRNPLPHGRGQEVCGAWLDDFNLEDRAQLCPCSDWVVRPNGDVHQCGCLDSPKIGNVFDGIDTNDFGDSPPDGGECWTHKDFQEWAGLIPSDEDDDEEWEDAA